MCKMRAVCKGTGQGKRGQNYQPANSTSHSTTKEVRCVHRAEGIRLFKLAGRPSGEQFLLVYGPKGPQMMTWDERAAKAGVDAEHFQAALAAKQSASVPYCAGAGGRMLRFLYRSPRLQNLSMPQLHVEQAGRVRARIRRRLSDYHLHDAFRS